MSDTLQQTYQTVNGYRANTKSMASPAAQTFTAPTNSYLSSVNLYFPYKSPKSDVPIVMQIRDTASNGQPGEKVYSESSVTWNNVNINDATNFHFDDPVLLQAGQKYAIVLYTDSLNYQLDVSVRDHLINNENPKIATQNPNGRVQGSFWYSINGTDWQMGDPSGQLGANAGGLCLKFDINAAQFNTDDTINFGPINPQAYIYGHSIYDTNDGNNKTNSMSYFTFNPSEETPYSTSIDWQYSYDGQTYWNLPINQSVRLGHALNDSISIRAILHGSEAISPVIEKNSLHLAVDRTADDNDYPEADGSLSDLPSNEYLNQFNQQNDSYNAAEYISRSVLFSRPGESDTNRFNQIYASYEELNSAKHPVDLFVNLNPDSNSHNNFQNRWIQMTGYDEHSHPSAGSTSWEIVDPRNSNAYQIDGNTGLADAPASTNGYTQHRYSEEVENTDNGTWVRHYFHLSLNRLYDDSNSRNQYFLNNGQPVGNEVKFKLVFHADSQYDHPKVRKFQTTVNKDDELESPGQTLS